MGHEPGAAILDGAAGLLKGFSHRFVPVVVVRSRATSVHLHVVNTCMRLAVGVCVPVNGECGFKLSIHTAMHATRQPKTKHPLCLWQERDMQQVGGWHTAGQRTPVGKRLRVQPVHTPHTKHPHRHTPHRQARRCQRCDAGQTKMERRQVWLKDTRAHPKAGVAQGYTCTPVQHTTAQHRVGSCHTLNNTLERAAGVGVRAYSSLLAEAG